MNVVLQTHFVSQLAHLFRCTRMIFADGSKRPSHPTLRTESPCRLLDLFGFYLQSAFVSPFFAILLFPHVSLISLLGLTPLTRMVRGVALRLPCQFLSRALHVHSVLLLFSQLFYRSCKNSPRPRRRWAGCVGDGAAASSLLRCVENCRSSDWRP